MKQGKINITSKTHHTAQNKKQPLRNQRLHAHVFTHTRPSVHLTLCYFMLLHCCARMASLVARGDVCLGVRTLHRFLMRWIKRRIIRRQFNRTQSPPHYLRTYLMPRHEVAHDAKHAAWCLHAVFLAMQLAIMAVSCNGATPAPAPPAPVPTPAPPVTPSPTPLLPTPQWASCPPAFTGIYSSCANVTVPTHWEGPASDGTVTFLLGRVQPANAVTPNTTVWFIGDGCLTALTPWVPTMTTRNWYVVAVHVRGSAFAYPSLSCPQGSLDPVTGWPLPSCGSNLSATRNGAISNAAFSLSEMARDLAYVVPLLGTARNVVVGDGFGTLLAQRLELLEPSAVAAVIMSGFTAPDRYDVLASTLDGFSTVARRVMDRCTRDPACAARLGGQDAWDLWLRLLQQAEEGSLTCAGQLSARWQTPDVATSLSNMVAMLVSSSQSPMFAPTTAPTQAFLPAFLYRVQRCLTEDVAALTTLYSALNQSATVTPPVGSCSVNPVLTFNIIVSELLQAPPAPGTVAKLLSEQPVRPLPTFFETVETLAQTWPAYNVPASQRSYGGSHIPTALVASSDDPFYPLGLASYAVGSSYKLSNDMFQVLEGGTHDALQTTGTACISSAVVTLGETPSASVPLCASVAATDFIGTTIPTATIQDYFGTTDPWAFTTPTPAVPIGPPATPAPSTPAPTPRGESVPPSAPSNGAAVGLGLALGVTWAAILLFAYHKKCGGLPCLRKERDFYSQLNATKE